MLFTAASRRRFCCRNCSFEGATGSRWARSRESSFAASRLASRHSTTAATARRQSGMPMACWNRSDIKPRSFAFAKKASGFRVYFALGEHSQVEPTVPRLGPILGRVAANPGRTARLTVIKRLPWRDDADRFAIQEAPNVLKDVGIIPLVVLLTDVAEMRRDDDVLDLAIGMIERQRLDVKHVEAGAGDLLLVERVEQRLLVDDRAARGVDQIGGLLHQPEFFRGDEPARAVAELKMDRHDVGVAEQVVLR